MPRIIAIDYGMKRCGLAWTDPLKIIATGIGAIDTAELIIKLKTLIHAEEVEEILLGYPTGIQGQDTDLTQPVREIFEKIKKLFPGIPVTLFDERYTSKLAVKAMIEGGMKKKKRQDKGMIDQLSATILLQQYLEK